MLNIPEVTSRCPTCFSPNPSLAQCPQCDQMTMCTSCISAGICDVCRRLMRSGHKKIEKKNPSAFKEAIILMNGLKPFLKPPVMKTLKTLTHISESDFDAIFKNIFQIKE